MANTSAAQDVAMEAEEEKDAQESSLYKEDSFRMYCMKVLPCSKSLEELRVPTCKPFVPPDALAAATTAAATDIARKAGANPLDPAMLRQLAEAVMSSAPQPGVQPVDLAQNLLQSNPSADALVRQLAQMQVQNQQVNYQQQQQDQLSAMSTLAAYLRDAQARQQVQAQAQSNPPQPTEPRLGDPSRAAAMSERQQLAFRSLSEAAVDNRYGTRRNSDALRAALQAPTPASSSFRGDIIQSQTQSQGNVHTSHVSSSGMSLAQQSLLYAPSQQHAAQQVAAQQAAAAQLNSSHQALFQPSQFPPTPGGATSNPFRSQNNSMDQGHRWSDPGRRPSFSQHDWMSTTSTPVSRYSQESEYLSAGRKGSFAAGGRLPSFDNRVRNSIDGRLHNSMDGRLHNSFDLDWAGRPRNDALSALIQAQGQDPFNPFQGHTFFHPNPAPQESPFPPTLDAFACSTYRDSQDSNASTLMHTDGSRPSMGDRPSLDSLRSGFGSPSSPTSLQANPPPLSQRDSLFAFGSGSNAHANQLQQQQRQQMQAAAPPGFGGMHSQGGHSHQGKAPPLGSGRGLETMPEDDDTMAMY